MRNLQRRSDLLCRFYAPTVVFLMYDTFVFELLLYLARRFLMLSRKLKTPAKSAPEIECQTHDTAEAIAASGIVGKCLADRTVARPAFCIPTSIETVRHLEFENFARRPVMYPKI